MQILLANDQEKAMTGRFELIEMTAQERLVQSGKRFGLVFIVALAAVFIPVFHFILVPLLLIAAVVVSLKVYRQRYQVHLIARGPCVVCREQMAEYFMLGEELQFSCDRCQAQYFISRQDAF